MKRIHTIVSILLLMLAVYLIIVGLRDAWSRTNEILMILVLAGSLTNLFVEKWFKRRKQLEGADRTEKQ